MRSCMSKEIRRCCSVIYALVGVLIVSCCVVIPAIAQESAQERAANLRAQLTEMQTKQAELQTRLQQLEEDIKPENIEHSLAGVGSIHPEDLREARRRQLEIQKKGIQSQLDNLATTRARLEAAIATADARSYRETVSPNPGGDISSIPKSKNAVVKKSVRQKHRLKRRRLHKR